MANLLIINSKNGKKFPKHHLKKYYTYPISDYLIFNIFCEDAKFRHQKRKRKRKNLLLVPK
jgi:hypothetical protein